jgi:hydroxymethylbilane synthase
MKPLVVGTRGSRLALIQTEEVLRQLRAQHPQQEFKVQVIRTGGDRSAEAPLDSLGLGIFVKEIEEALLRGDVDLAVHSLKDLTPELPRGLAIGAICQRQDPRDILVNRWDCGLSDLPAGARIGTSSPRRTAQLKALRPDLVTIPIRGNVETRINKAMGADYDSVVLAAAGVLRLGLQHRIAQYLPVEEFIPAPGQGALAVEVRRNDQEVADAIMAVDHLATRRAVTAERAFLERLGSGCQVPSAAYAKVSGDTMVMLALLASPDGRQMFTTKAQGRAAYPHEIAMEAHQRLIEKGATELMSTYKTC